jgi:Prealbumin-like fold domain
MKKKRRLIAGLAALGVILALTIPALATGSVGTASGFEDDDGNLAPAAPINFDWNSFDPVDWLGNAPDRIANKTLSGWRFEGLEDAQSTTSDDAFAGGVKQDNDCATVITAKAPNKDDLKRVYLASKTVSGHTFLNLAWVRIPQNSPSPSAHIGFEFNRGKTECPATADGLVRRSADDPTTTANDADMLIIYNFEGGNTTPVITLSRWVTSGACDVGSNSPPCWSPKVTLPAGVAEAQVNHGGSGVPGAGIIDALAPPAPPATASVDETLGVKEFGEAGIDLTAAGVFSPNECVTFGKAFAVSRSSGQSEQAQMKDLVGPADFELSNCGSITIIKQTDPRGVNQDFSYTTTGGLSPSTFTLNDTGNSGKTLGSTDPAQNSAGNTRTYTNVLAGSYSVTEGADPAGFTFDSLTCTATGTGTSVTTSSKTANITLAGGGTVTCLYVNEQQLGAIKVSKTSSKTGNPLADAQFSVTGPGGFSTTLTTGADGTDCVDSLAFGTYTVTETAAPAGFVIDDPSGRTVMVDNNALCSDSPYGGESESFTDTPTADIQVRFKDGGSGETHLQVGTPLECDNTTGTDDAADTTGWDDTLTVNGIEIDSNTVTVTCTIVIDP